MREKKVQATQAVSTWTHIKVHAASLGALGLVVRRKWGDAVRGGNCTICAQSHCLIELTNRPDGFSMKH